MLEIFDQVSVASSLDVRTPFQNHPSLLSTCVLWKHRKARTKFWTRRDRAISSAFLTAEVQGQKLLGPGYCRALSGDLGLDGATTLLKGIIYDEL